MTVKAYLESRLAIKARGLLIMPIGLVITRSPATSIIIKEKGKNNKFVTTDIVLMYPNFKATTGRVQTKINELIIILFITGFYSFFV